jgi:hypothetical protein
MAHVAEDDAQLAGVCRGAVVYVSKAFAKAFRTLGLWHISTGSYTPKANGKAERFIHTLCRE